LPYPIDKKFVIAIASSALFDLSESDKVFREKGAEEYREYQEENINTILRTGAAFPFIRRFLRLNQVFPDKQPVEVVLLSRNSPETGLRVFNSIKHYNLDITRAAFFSGGLPFRYIPAFNASLFLSANKDDVINAIKAGFPAGRVIENSIIDDENDLELRLAFDFDGVIVDDAAERVYKESNDLSLYHLSEQNNAEVPLNPGPLQDMFKKLSFFQKLEKKKLVEDSSYVQILKTAIITARNAPAHARMVNTLKSWGVSVDEVFFLGGIEKKRILEVMKPHMYFDDQSLHLNTDSVPQVHIPFGITNEEIIQTPSILAETGSTSEI
jgi:5'-nucleotidase